MRWFDKTRIHKISKSQTHLYIKKGFKVFTRQSEYEEVPILYADSQGIWLDEFENHWISLDIIKKHTNSNKKVCIVSPELHKRESFKEWENYKKFSKLFFNDEIILCTDKPEKAKHFFYEN